MLIAHISDLHIFCGKPRTALLRMDAVERGKALVVDLVKLAPDIVAITGDLTDDGGAAEHELLRELLAPLHMPVLFVPGNHDVREELRTAFPTQGWTCPDFLQVESVHSGVRFLALDTLSPGEVCGRLCSTRIDWLRDRLAHQFSGPTFILMHHPPMPTALGALDRNTLVEGREALGELVATMPEPPVILCGHLHLGFQALWAGALVSVASSTAFAYSLELGAEQEPPLNDRIPFAYDLHVVGTDGHHIVHHRYPAL